MKQSQSTFYKENFVSVGHTLFAIGLALLLAVLIVTFTSRIP